MPRVVSPGTALLATAVVACAASGALGETITIGIGTQDTTTNTVTGGVILKKLGLLEKHLPRTGKYDGVDYKLDWQNATSAPPITNAMMAGNIQIAMMGDYPMLFNGATGQATGNETEFIAVAAYNAHGGGNGIVVNSASPYYALEDLQGETVSVPFGSAAHGMMLNALQQNGLPEDFWHLVSQTPEVGSTNLQENRIAAHGDFVPFAELLPYRGFARKIFDGVQTGIPTFHGVVVRKDFAATYPEIVTAYLEALLEANQWLRDDPKGAAEKIEDWTGIEKEVVYAFLGPGGIQTLDPTIKPQWVEALHTDYAVLERIGLVKPLTFDGWVNDTYIRQAFADAGLDYDGQLARVDNYQPSGDDPVCRTPIDDPAHAGQIWVEGGDITTYASPVCTLKAAGLLEADGQALGAVYLVDQALGIRLFADAAFYVVGGADPAKPEITPFLLKADAEAFAARSGGRLASYPEALAAAAALIL